MSKPQLLILAVCLVIPTEPPKDDATAKDKERLQGKWKCESIESMGINLVGQDFRECKMDLDFKTDKLIVKSRNKTENWGYKLDSMSNPKSIDLTYQEAGKSVMGKGIYDLGDDTLIICWSVPEAARPKEFKSNPKTSNAVLVFKRERN
jgi:uncharacterized protein (TIGR03067 family)